MAKQGILILLSLIVRMPNVANLDRKYFNILLGEGLMCSVMHDVSKSAKLFVTFLGSVIVARKTFPQTMGRLGYHLGMVVKSIAK